VRLYGQLENLVKNGSMSWLALHNEAMWDMAEVILLWKEAASQGLREAMYNLAIMYRQGRGVEQSDLHAAHWYQRASDLGHANAQNNLGFMYNHGRVELKEGIDSEAEAVRMYRLAAMQGLADAQYNLGVMYRQGRGVEQCDIEALHWYTLARDSGSLDASIALARLKKALELSHVPRKSGFKGTIPRLTVI
jgi:hypothetical protein